MQDYKVSETVAVWVTFETFVTANSKEEAMQAVKDGFGMLDPQSPQIGDSIDGYDTIWEVQEQT